MKYEKKVALHALQTLHAAHPNFAKTLLKNMHSYVHPLHNQATEDPFRRVVELLPLSSRTMNMELLELYLTILSRVITEVLAMTQKKVSSWKKRRRNIILKIVLTSLLDCADNYSLLREWVFNTVLSWCKKALENKFDILPTLSDFLVLFLCRFPLTLDEKPYRMALDLLHSHQVPEDKKQLRLLYCIHAHFPSFFENSRLLGYLREKIRPISFETFEVYYIHNAELYRLETFLDDIVLLNKHFTAFRKDSEKMRQYFVFVNLFCFKKKVLCPFDEVPAPGGSP